MLQEILLEMKLLSQNASQCWEAEWGKPTAQIRDRTIRAIVVNSEQVANIGFSAHPELLRNEVVQVLNKLISLSFNL
jgi:hypothetical protein